MTATIKGYKFQVRDIEVWPELWKDETKTITPLDSMSGTAMHEVLDTLTIAVEAGVVNAFKWPQQFFASKPAFLEFIEQLEEYDDCYRITDRWWQALAALIGGSDEEGFVSAREIAETLARDVETNGLLSWSKSRKLRYTAKQYETACYDMVVASRLPPEMRDRFSQEARTAHNEVVSYCSRFADYPEMSDERRAQAEAEITAARAAVKKVKNAPAKKAPAKKAK